jgi:hypothetical protein
MATKMAKREWVVPELIILVRSKPEEAVLLGCKAHAGPGGGAGTDPAACDISCSACLAHTAS